MLTALRHPVDAARAHAHHAVAARGQRRVMRHQHQRGAAAGVAREQQIDDLLAGGLVEIAGRLVGHQDRRIGRQRARERHALLLAARQFGRIMVEPLGQADGGEFLRVRAPARRRRRPVPAAPRRSPARSWSGSDGTTGTRCRHGGRGSAPAHPRRAGSSSSPATVTVPLSGRSSPAITISSVDLPEPDGPTRPNASPRPISRPMSLRIWMRPAPWPSDRFTPASAMAGAVCEGALMRFCGSRPGSYGGQGLSSSAPGGA